MSEAVTESFAELFEESLKDLNMKVGSVSYTHLTLPTKRIV